ncbi:MAG: hypothetical protein WCL53_04275 [Chloroflexota bacterium]
MRIELLVLRGRGVVEDTAFLDLALHDRRVERETTAAARSLDLASLGTASCCPLRWTSTTASEECGAGEAESSDGKSLHHCSTSHRAAESLHSRSPLIANHISGRR